MPCTVCPLSWYLILSAILFALGIAGFLFRKNIITVFMSIELMLNAVNLIVHHVLLRAQPAGRPHLHVFRHGCGGGRSRGWSRDYPDGLQEPQQL